MRSMFMTVVLRTSCFVPVLSVLPAIGCSDDGGGGQATPSGGYPRQVVVEYRVTSTTGLTKANVMYTNDTGGFTSEDDAPLPFSKKLTRTVKRSDSLSLSVRASVPGSLGVEIAMDESTVDKKTFSGTTVISGSSVYVFP